MKTPTLLAERVRRLRETAGLNPRALSLLAGLDNSHIRLIELGERGSNITYDTVSRLARVLGSSVEWLGSGDGDPPTDAEVVAAVDAARARKAAA